ncbi:thrombospondin-1-like [Haliotis cracherodii]|uniref:thrombospondin-1-like n=1 Tax=Haliotis cracherodii TaxID=6455 RepID=UPI0039E73715
MRGAWCIAVVSVTLWAAFAAADRCQYSCSKQERSNYECGWWGWKRCSRYRSVPSTCYRDCTHGQWSAFSLWEATSTCSHTCGGGEITQQRTRQCNNPAPSNGGRPCEGETSETRTSTCNTHPCPIAGGWSAWTEWTPIDECPALCGGGKADLTRSRTCTNPSPQYGGADCVGQATQTTIMGDCNVDSCADVCAPGNPTVVHHETKEHLYYECDEAGDVAYLEECPDFSTFSPIAETCTPLPCNIMDGLYQTFPGDCRKYFMCLAGTRTIDLVCPSGKVFNGDTRICDDPATTQICGM